MSDQRSNGQQQPNTSSSKVHLSLGQHVVASSTGGLIARGVTYPLDTLKTILQVHTAGPRVSPSMTKMAYLKELQRPFREVIRNRGLLSLYQGVGIACLLGTPALSVYYTTYDKSKELICSALGAEETTLVHVASATAAEVVSGLIWTPMELVKQRLQVKRPLKSEVVTESVISDSSLDGTKRSTNSTAGLLQKIHAKHGYSGFYRGYLLTLMVFVPFSACYFISYENLKSLMMRRHLHASGGKQTSALPSQELSFIQYMSASAVSAVVGSVIANPMDVVKTRWQVNKQIPPGVKSPYQLARHMLQSEGASSFAKGVGARALYTVPYVAISMAIYELIKIRLS